MNAKSTPPTPQATANATTLQYAFEAFISLIIPESETRRQVHACQRSMKTVGGERERERERKREKAEILKLNWISKESGLTNHFPTLNCNGTSCVIGKSEIEKCIRSDPSLAVRIQKRPGIPNNKHDYIYIYIYIYTLLLLLLL